MAKETPWNLWGFQHASPATPDYCLIPVTEQGNAGLSDFRWLAAFLAAALTGLFATAVVMPLLGPGFGTVFAGVLTVLFYRPKNAERLLASLSGVILAVLTAIAASSILSISIWLRATAFHNGVQLEASFRHLLEQAAVFVDVEAAPKLIVASDSPSGLAAFMLVLFTVLSTCAYLGCTIGALLWRVAKKSGRSNGSQNPEGVSSVCTNQP